MSMTVEALACWLGGEVTPLFVLLALRRDSAPLESGEDSGKMLLTPVSATEK